MSSSGHVQSRPLGELTGSGDRELLDESRRKFELAAEKRGELERRLKNVANYIGSIDRRCAEASLESGERERLLNDRATAERQGAELESEIAEIQEEIAFEQGRQDELTALVAEEEEKGAKSSVWMVSSLGVPGPARSRDSGPGIPAEATNDPAAKQEAKDGGGEGGDGDSSSDDEINVDEEVFEDDEDDEDVGEAVPLNNPEGICVSASGIVYVTDSVRSCIRGINQRGKVYAVAGRDVPGHKDGAADAAMFRHPRGLCLVPGDQEDKVVMAVCDTENHCIRLVRQGMVSTLAGGPGESGHADGVANQARFHTPWNLCSVDEGRSLLVCDSGNHCVRKISGLGGDNVTVTTLFGKPGHSGCGGDELHFPWSICVLNGSILVGDKLNQRLVMFASESDKIPTILSDLWPEGAQFSPRGLAAAGSALYMSHSWHSQIWRLDHDSDGKLCALDRIAGTGLPNHRDGKGELCEFFCPCGLAVDAAGAVYVADYSNHCVRKCRELRSEEVKQKLAKLVRDINNRWVVACFIKWSNSVQVREPIEPLDAVMALAMGTHYRVGDESVLQSLCTSDACSQILLHIIHATAKSLGWRVVRTRDEVIVPGDVEAGDDPSGANLEAEMAEHLAEAKSAFLLYDKDGGGTIDAGELLEALAAADMEVTPEEVADMIREFGKDEITFPQFCQLLGVEVPQDEEEERGDATDTDPSKGVDTATTSTALDTSTPHVSAVPPSTDQSRADDAQ